MGGGHRPWSLVISQRSSPPPYLAAGYPRTRLLPTPAQLGNRQASPSLPLVDYYTVPAMGKQPGTSPSAPIGNGVSWFQPHTISRFCRLHGSFFRETPREWALLGWWRPQRARGVGTNGQGASWKRGPRGFQVGGGEGMIGSRVPNMA